MRKKRKNYIKKQFPVIQGHLIAESKTELCATERYKTSFDIIDIATNKQISCVFWSFTHPIKKGQLVAVEGTQKNGCFICFKVQKIDRPYVFG